MSARRGGYTRWSCDRCHDQKLRCEREPHRTCCARCRRAGAECTLTAPPRRRTRAGVFVFSKHCATLDGRGNNPPNTSHTAAPRTLDSGMAPFVLDSAEAQSLGEKESRVPAAIKWTFAEHLTLPIDYSVKATAIGGHVDTNRREPPESRRQNAEPPSLRPIDRGEELNMVRRAPASAWNFASCDFLLPTI
ncbi:hypothetical protein CONLIGDRAFT_626300 [Coniochaeta ligniaria NRRL 30616]|uniref:Zn(2)-C6 fungal-type domain-containing protein n=1 Tax=Coniochaeta ligniaria NRRL 30616 TaxID=1408157 RepID=A0A1J7JLH3_9PEZI|nr:hypothetical protein CONLIGDRAFT_626300 [Coniochaeta ligniaria NRRL 30616]